MKRIFFLVLSLFLLTGCVYLPESEPVHTLAPTEKVTLPTETSAPTVETTLPTSTPTEETTLPTTSATEETTLPDPAPEATVPTLSPASAAGFDAVYAEICQVLDIGDTETEYRYVGIGILEVLFAKTTKEERYDSITYALEDMDGDGAVEMIVLDAMGNTRILAIYALRDGQPEKTHEGIFRGRLYRLDDNTLYYEGTGGAAFSIFEAYDQLWFTYPKGEDQEEIGYYYAGTGNYDPATSQEITPEEYNNKQAEFAGRITPFPAYSFS